jgi:hypothetical protein
MNKLKQELIQALNIDDEMSLDAVKAIVQDCKKMLSKSDGKILDEAYNYQKNNPLSEVVWRKISSEFSPEQIQMFLDVNNSCLEAMDESSAKIGEILAKVKMDTPLAEEYKEFLEDEFSQNKVLH